MMENNKYREALEKIGPHAGLEEHLLHKITESSEGATGKLTNSRRRTKPKLMLVAAIIVCIMTTTVVASAFSGLDNLFFNFLKPSSKEQLHNLENGIYEVNKQITDKNGTLHIKQVIGDSNLTYILMDFTASEETVLDAARYRFNAGRLNYDFGPDNSNLHGPGFTLLDDGHPNDNKISLVMSLVTKNSTQGGTLNIRFDGLEAADPLPGVFETVVAGKWEADLKLDFINNATMYSIHKPISIHGYQATLSTISISPISIALKLNSPFAREINNTAREVNETDLNRGEYPVTIIYKDGTTEATSTIDSTEVMTSYTDNTIIAITPFEKVINDKEIESIVFFDTVIPIS